MAVEFHDYSFEVKGAMDDRINGVLAECAGLIISQTKRNSRVSGEAGSRTKNSWEYKVDEDSHTAYMGSNYENAIWEEFGTGEHAIPEGGGGRKGYWVFVKGSDGKTSRSGKSYSLKEAKRVMAIMRSKGLEAYYTNGKKPSRAFWKAYTSLRGVIMKRINNSFKGL